VHDRGFNVFAGVSDLARTPLELDRQMRINYTKKPSIDKIADTGSGGTEVKNLMVRQNKGSGKKVNINVKPERLRP
jgi:hypothetical protein